MCSQLLDVFPPLVRQIAVHALGFFLADKDRSGTVENRELAKIIAEYFPEASQHHK